MCFDVYVGTPLFRESSGCILFALRSVLPYDGNGLLRTSDSSGSIRGPAQPHTADLDEYVRLKFCDCGFPMRQINMGARSSTIANAGFANGASRAAVCGRANNSQNTYAR